MSELGTTAVLPTPRGGSEPGAAGSPPSLTPGARPKVRGLIGLAMDKARSDAAARVGATWLVVVGFFAVFAPVLANSRPILLKINGQWSSPMLNGLEWTDVFVFISVFGGIAIIRFVPKVGAFARMLLVGALMIVAGTACFLALGERSDRVFVYSTYREASAAGQVQWVMNAPIPYSPSDYLRDEFKPDDPFPWAPRHGHWMGTEINGSDITSRMIHACRIALSVGLVAEGVSMVVGTVIGALMGYFGGVVDLLGMRLLEIFSSIPQFYLLLACVAFFSRNLYLIMLIIGLTSWTGYSAFIRAQFLSLRNQDFVQAARAAGLPTWRIVFLHVLPSGIAPVLVSATFGVASAITAEAGLSFLGIGPVDVASWGALLIQAIAATRFYWWLGLFPGMAIFLTVLSYNLIGESLRDALDPRSHGRS